MNAQALAELKARLEDEYARLTAEVAVHAADSRDSLSEATGENAYRDHMADQGTATFERELDMTLEENLRDSLGRVRRALDRIEAGAYGDCERCGAEIPEERLRAVPTASLCVPCKSEDESL